MQQAHIVTTSQQVAMPTKSSGRRGGTGRLVGPGSQNVSDIAAEKPEPQGAEEKVGGTGAREPCYLRYSVVSDAGSGLCSACARRVLELYLQALGETTAFTGSRAVVQGAGSIHRTSSGLRF
eukprot:499658-Heterocapsa_arctica.AAC.1